MTAETLSLYFDTLQLAAESFIFVIEYFLISVEQNFKCNLKNYYNKVIEIQKTIKSDKIIITYLI